MVKNGRPKGVKTDHVHYPVATKFSEIAIYPNFSTISTDIILPDSVWLCQDDGSHVAFISREGKNKALNAYRKKRMKERKETGK